MEVLSGLVIPEVVDPARILVALNQADIAIKHGCHWDYEVNRPDETLRAFLEEKVRSVGERILEDTGVEIEPIYYCAGCKDGEEVVVAPYNMAKLLYCIVAALTAEKRVPILEGLNNDRDAFVHNDDELDYGAVVEENFFETLDCMIGEGAESGADVAGPPRETGRRCHRRRCGYRRRLRNRGPQLFGQSVLKEGSTL